ncbi:MAG TPA: prephenate dehydratase domain-containing protein [Gemmatimonadaceae bacterium]
MVRVAYQGERGAYSELAIAARWRSAEPVPRRECADVVRAVTSGAADIGLLAVENTLAGSVLPSWDALVSCDDVVATDELVLGIHHCLVAPPGATLAGIRRVESHPVALAQCRGLFERHAHLRPRAAYDTAGAARAVARARDPRRAALASRAAAEHYGLAVLAADVEDRPDNQTRFLAVAAEGAPLAPGTPARTIFGFATANVPGALWCALAPFAAEGLNLGSILSRPAGNPWTYRFIIEIEHAAADPALDRALAALAAVTTWRRSLGTVARGAPGAC